MATRPVNPGADYAAVVDGLDLVTVRSIKPDDGSTLLTCENVTCLQKRDSLVTVPVGEGEVGAARCGFTLVAAGLTFAPKDRDQITDAGGVVWEIGNVQAGGFGTMWHCDDCVKKRVNS
ncbi:unnamed protein product [Gemmataceae bacterium]|nr:unnamed protein product [Gemmataceae bacterium]VTT98936.1 unnamed protein product [Gemmataceae bacterium]